MASDVFCSGTRSRAFAFSRAVRDRALLLLLLVPVPCRSVHLFSRRVCLINVSAAVPFLLRMQPSRVRSAAAALPLRLPHHLHVDALLLLLLSSVTVLTAFNLSLLLYWSCFRLHCKNALPLPRPPSAFRPPQRFRCRRWYFSSDLTSRLSRARANDQCSPAVPPPRSRSRWPAPPLLPLELAPAPPQQDER